MANQNYSTTISIDSERSAFHFYSMIGTDTSSITLQTKSFAGKAFDEDFYKRFKDSIKEVAENAPSESIRKISLVLPDNAILTDTIRIPTMKGFGQTKKTLDITLGGLYNNYNNLRVISYIADQNRQYTSFAISAIQKQLATSVYAACSENKLLVETLTSAASASVCGALMLNPKLKNASYLFLDIKDVYSRFVFVANGRAVGSYTLPFGLEFLRKPKITQEDMLFDHSYAELMVLNARERAKSKRLTVMSMGGDLSESMSELFNEAEEAEAAQENAEETAEEEQNTGGEATESGEAGEGNPDAEGSDLSEAAPSINMPTGGRPAPAPKIFTRKSPRRLPKFMQREVPDTEEGIACENFRVFLKWALTLIHENKKLTDLGKPEFVCVNLPQDLSMVIDKTNEEAEESGISFVPLPVENVDPAVTANLELYGGLFPKMISQYAKF